MVMKWAPSAEYYTPCNRIDLRLCVAESYFTLEITYFYGCRFTAVTLRSLRSQKIITYGGN
jgi:hypothetical protein